jgi:SAM-dependent methyltransferase
MTNITEDPWSGDYKIPWNEPAFSRRMLAEHLSQAHDLASRRVEFIDRQVEWIDREVAHQQPVTILDLGCGPGLYCHRLTRRGHQCRGIDFGPASIEYAICKNPDPARCTFTLGDMRAVEFGGPYDLVMLLYGEFNVFSPSESAHVLAESWKSLNPSGSMLIETQTPEIVKAIGHAESTVEQSPPGLFSDRPHSCRTQCSWNEEHRVAMQTFTISSEGNPDQLYRSTTKAWTDDELRAAMYRARFRDVSRRTDWPCNTENLELWIARK